jgi:hypothetical protein
MVDTAKLADKGVTGLEEWESWERLKIHHLPVNLFMGRGSGGIQELGKLLEAENPYVKVPMPARWLGNQFEIKRRFLSGEIRVSSAVFTVKGKDVASHLIQGGVRVAGLHFAVERFINRGHDSLCETCNFWGHYADRCPQPSMPRCAICAKAHHAREHTCELSVCTHTKGKVCTNTVVKCPNCKGAHTATNSKCPNRREAIEKAIAARTNLKSRIKERKGLTSTPENIEVDHEGPTAEHTQPTMEVEAVRENGTETNEKLQATRAEIADDMEMATDLCN